MRLWALLGNKIFRRQGNFCHCTIKAWRLGCVKRMVVATLQRAYHRVTGILSSQKLALHWKSHNNVVIPLILESSVSGFIRGILRLCILALTSREVEELTIYHFSSGALHFLSCKDSIIPPWRVELPTILHNPAATGTCRWLWRIANYMPRCKKDFVDEKFCQV